MLAGCAAAAWIAFLYRQNGVALLAALALGVVGLTQVAYRLLSVAETHPERIFLIYDLAALTVETGEQKFPAKVLHGPRGVVPPDLRPGQIPARFDHKSILTLYPNGDWAKNFRDESLARREATELSRAWREAVLENPG